jgi:hypothetical protein
MTYCTAKCANLLPAFAKFGANLGEVVAIIAGNIANIRAQIFPLSGEK